MANEKKKNNSLFSMLGGQSDVFSMPGMQNILSLFTNFLKMLGIDFPMPEEWSKPSGGNSSRPSSGGSSGNTSSSYSPAPSPKKDIDTTFGSNRDDSYTRHNELEAIFDRKDYSDNFKFAARQVLLNEGALNANKGIVTDGGGYTKYGIATKYNEGVDVKNLTLEGAIDIYYDRYWLDEIPGIEDMPRDIATMIFDASLNQGKSFVQGHEKYTLTAPLLTSFRDRFNLPEDPKDWDLSAENPLHVKVLAELRRDQYEARVVEDPSTQEYFGGWINRLDDKMLPYIKKNYDNFDEQKFASYVEKYNEHINPEFPALLQPIESTPRSGPSQIGPLQASSGFDTERAMKLARTDNAGGGYCGKGAANVLLDQGFPIQRGNGEDWNDNFDANPDWIKLDGVKPHAAPEGAVLCYNSDKEYGKSPRNSGGGKWGHVEVVGIQKDGDRTYISDKPRDNFGGTVPDNYAGAYVYAPRGSAIRAELTGEAPSKLNDSFTTASLGDSTLGKPAVDKPLDPDAIRQTVTDAVLKI